MKSVEAKHEELFDLLRNGDVELHVGNDGIEEIDTLINVSGMSPLRAADRYLADHHPEVLL
ncbi:hypothetical protein ACFYXS_06370 [Streptomyces sp. NPDC002574]|uniref:hypothetical protein n=1 Tax=Streptomyces sp. NPDC002574 TaxID=3364652 RepID=UPI003678A75E